MTQFHRYIKKRLIYLYDKWMRDQTKNERETKII